MSVDLKNSLNSIVLLSFVPKQHSAEKAFLHYSAGQEEASLPWHDYLWALTGDLHPQR